MSKMYPALLLMFMSIVGSVMSQVIYLFAMRQNAKRNRFEMLARRQINERRRRRRRMIRYFALLMPKRRKRGHRRHTSSHWWDNVVPLFTDREWIDNFRIRKATFDWICMKLHDILKPHPKPVIQNQPLQVEKIVAIALYKLAHLAEYLVVANLFGVCKSTVHNSLYAFCYAITDVLGEELIKLPDAEEAKEIAQHFEQKTHIPQIIGAIDGSHIPITPPSDGNSDFINRKMYHSFVLQGIVDHRYLFRNISCKLPGSCHDADVLRESTFYKERETLMPKGMKEVAGMNIPFIIIGDPAYPLQTWLVKNYSYDRNITPFMDSFNVHLNKGRVVVENAFGRLKARWRILARQSDVHYTFVPIMVAACCILHNICELNKETFHDRWLDALHEDERDYPQPETLPYDVENQYDAADVRDHLMIYISDRFELLTSSRGRCAGL